MKDITLKQDKHAKVIELIVTSLSLKVIDMKWLTKPIVWWVPIITVRIRRMGEGNSFDLFVSPHPGVPREGPDVGLYPG